MEYWGIVGEIWNDSGLAKWQSEGEVDVLLRQLRNPLLNSFSVRVVLIVSPCFTAGMYSSSLMYCWVSKSRLSRLLS